MSLSVVIVTLGKNHEGMIKLRDALNEQTDINFERIFVYPADAEMVPLLGEELTFIRQPGKGICDARNAGIAASHGDIIAFTDDDSEPCSRWIEKIKETFIEYPELDYIGGEFVSQPHSIWQKWVSKRYHLNESALKAGLCHGNNMAYRRRVFDLALFDSSIIFGADEVEFQTRIQKLGMKGRTFPHILIRHDHRDSFLSFTKSRLGYAKGNVQFYKKTDRELFNWTDMINILFGFSLITFRPLLAVLFMYVILYRTQASSLSLYLIDVYVSLLWTYSRAWYSVRSRLGC